MYSPKVVDFALYKLKARGTKWERRDVGQCIDIAKKLTALYDFKTGQYTRALTLQEATHVRSETILCRHDFRYFAERYGTIDLDASTGGGVGPMTFWASQLRALELIAKREEEIYDNYHKHGFSDGILSVWHKSRQLGATAIMRLINAHRMLLWKHTRCIAGSLDIDKIHELYVRDKTVLENLPPFLIPSVEFDVKDSHIAYSNLKSRLTYQQANQKAGVGIGQQFDISHMTEVAFWEMAPRLKLDFLPAVPQSPTTFVAFESTANGRGNFWHEFTEDVRMKHEGFQSWIYIFTPWYIEDKKYRRIPPEGWVPNDVSKEHAEMIDRTSTEFCGKRVTPTRDQLYWWESEYMMHKKEGSLNIFLSNYCATPEQSFQHSTRAALPIEIVDRMRSTSIMGMPYAFEITRRTA